MKITTVFMTVLPLLAACATARPLTLPSGGRGQVISCNGMARTMSDCYVKAGEVCQAGYDLIDARGESHPVLFAS